MEKTLSGVEKIIFDEIVKGFDYLKKHAFSSWDGVFITQTVDDLLFGYEDSMLKLIHDLKPDLVSSSIFSFSVSIIIIVIKLIVLYILS